MVVTYGMTVLWVMIPFKGAFRVTVQWYPHLGFLRVSKISQLISCLGNYLTDVLGLNVGLFHLDGKKTVSLSQTLPLCIGSKGRR